MAALSSSDDIHGCEFVETGSTRGSELESKQEPRGSSSEWIAHWPLTDLAVHVALALHLADAEALLEVGDMHFHHEHVACMSQSVHLSEARVCPRVAANTLRPGIHHANVVQLYLC